MKSFMLGTCLVYCCLAYGQNTPHMGVSVAENSATEKVYNYYVWEYRSIIASQYSMVFDSTKMAFREIRNSILQGLGNSNFGSPQPGIITSVWIDLDLDGDDYIDSTVLYQLVFDIIIPGGSTLCFSNTPLEYEFADESEEINEIFIHDDCEPGTLVIINPTAIRPIDSEEFKTLKALHLSSDGALSFTSSLDQSLALELIDIQGRRIASTASALYTIGRNTLAIPLKLMSGVYILQTRDKNGQLVNYKLMVL